MVWERILGSWWWSPGSLGEIHFLWSVTGIMKCPSGRLLSSSHLALGGLSACECPYQGDLEYGGQECYIKSFPKTRFPIPTVHGSGKQKNGGQMPCFIYLTQDLWVFNCVNGYTIDLLSKPHQQAPPKELHFSKEDTLNLSILKCSVCTKELSFFMLMM